MSLAVRQAAIQRHYTNRTQTTIRANSWLPAVAAALRRKVETPHNPGGPLEEIIKVDPVLDAGDETGSWEVQLRWDELPESNVMLRVFDGPNELSTVVADSRDDALLEVIGLLMPPEKPPSSEDDRS
jgi:hypothetical protein